MMLKSSTDFLKYIQIAGFCALGLALPTSFAGTMGEVGAPFSYVVSLGLGPLWSSGQDPQTLELTPTIVKHYTNTDSNSALLGGEVFIGVQKPLWNFLGQLGLAVAATSQEKFSGEIWDDADPEFNNFTYRFKVQHTALRVKGKLISRNQFHGIAPWISAALGVAWNNAKDFTNTPTIFEALPNPNFSDRSNTAFTYNLGVGLQREITPHLVAGLGYDFTDWGKFALGRAQGQTLGEGLSNSHTYTNGLMFSLAYVG